MARTTLREWVDYLHPERSPEEREQVLRDARTREAREKLRLLADEKEAAEWEKWEATRTRDVLAKLARTSRPFACVTYRPPYCAFLYVCMAINPGGDARHVLLFDVELYRRRFDPDELYQRLKDVRLH